MSLTPIWIPACMHALHTCVPHTHTPIHLQYSFYLCDNSKITANHCDTIAQTIKCILKRGIKLVTLFNIFVYRISYSVFCYFYFHLEQIFNNLPIGSCVAEWSEDLHTTFTYTTSDVFSQLPFPSIWMSVCVVYQ